MWKTTSLHCGLLFITIVTAMLLNNFALKQWCAEIWGCLGRLLDWMPPSQFMVLSSGVKWSLLLDIRCLWRHNMTSYSRLQTNVLAKFVDTACVFRDARAAVWKQSRRHVGFLWAFPPKQSSKLPQIELWSTISRWRFYDHFRMSSPPIQKGRG